ncbi:efflux RND transporter periplasmic adaptor subunit [Alteromonas pelagimontana]|uniref:Efflux RND transporter periplasmic adaptor subunit n=1 Tax=Alteromonas pelagimontana TaxID=1858656 RepID=A0A6M4M7W0_9ALTE|nr:efflux RND transporter periplasmic adaptor subunit [Alteromonas pelagimontana]QJR79324.1 efflux RND transporter periplasmic adaptor subunit [Alteromonas pelagimontana]
MIHFPLSTKTVLRRQAWCIKIFVTLLMIGTGITGCSENSGATKEKGAEQGKQEGSQETQQPGSAGSRPVPVAFVEVAPTQIQYTEKLPGRVVSYRIAEIRPQVSGIIQARFFEEGSFVEQGEQLYQIDPARYQADLEVAQANLENAQATVNNALAIVGRYETLADINALSEQEFDNAKMELKQAQASVSQAEAEVKTAKINLAYTKVYAPISGFISPSSVTKGALVTQQQQEALATIRQLDPVFVDLSQSVGDAQQLKARLIESRIEERDDQEFEVSLFFAESGEPYPYKGKLDATDLAVDQQTGAIRLRSVFPNPDNLLLPGLFVRASIEDLSSSEALVVPQQSVTIGEGGKQHVWVIDKKDKVSKRAIQTGVAYEDKWVIEDGLQPGERVVVEGTMTLKDGAPVKPEKFSSQNQSDNNRGKPAKEAQQSGQAL